MTGQNVTECIGGARGDHRRRLKPTATTPTATRGSTPSQALELAFLIAEELKRARGGERRLAAVAAGD
jgi:3-deoxy-D-arabino-heptulosonate 7-phosphate (DAHP) synthase class II